MIGAILLKLPLMHYLAASIGACNLPGADKNPFLGFPHWWVYMKGVSDGAGGCTPDFAFPGGIFQIGLAAIDILLHVAGFVAVIAIIVSGISYMFAIGNPEKITSARKGIQNSLIGLGIALAAAQIVAFIGARLS